MRARNKIEFRVGAGPGNTSRKRCYRWRSPAPLFSLSLPFFSPVLSWTSNTKRIFVRMKFGFEVNPLVRNQSRPHRITGVAAENDFLDFKRLTELRFTERDEKGRGGRSCGGEKNLENARHATLSNASIVKFSVPRQRRISSANANGKCGLAKISLFDEIWFFMKSTLQLIFFLLFEFLMGRNLVLG